MRETKGDSNMVKHTSKILFAAFVLWCVLFIVFFATMLTSSDWSRMSSDAKFIEIAVMGPGAFLLGMIGGGILFGVFYQAKALRPAIKNIGLLAAVAISLCVVTANLIWGFARSMPWFDVALGLGFSGAGLLWAKRGVARNWGSTDGKN